MTVVIIPLYVEEHNNENNITTLRLLMMNGRTSGVAVVTVEHLMNMRNIVLYIHEASDKP